MKQIIKAPLMTEKTAAGNEHGEYAFIVDRSANKIQIKAAVEALYSVNVEKVRTINVMGKSKVRYTKSRVMAGRKPSYKKAIVKLAEGELIDIYENLA